MPPRLLVFDLDGTLIDSEQDLANSVNALLHQLGKSALPLAAIRSYIGDGASMLVRRALGDPEGDLHDPEYIASAVSFFVEHYRAHKLDNTRPYPGVLDALHAISASYPDTLLAVLTNKPVRPSREICAGLNLAPFFFQVYGGDSFHLKKPDPTGLKALISEASLNGLSASPILPAETIMIGDSPIDIATAQAADTLSIGCTFGLSPATLALTVPSALAHSPAEWPALIASF